MLNPQLQLHLARHCQVTGCMPYLHRGHACCVLPVSATCGGVPRTRLEGRSWSMLMRSFKELNGDSVFPRVCIEGREVPDA